MSDTYRSPLSEGLPRKSSFSWEKARQMVSSFLGLLSKARGERAVICPTMVAVMKTLPHRPLKEVGKPLLNPSEEILCFSRDLTLIFYKAQHLAPNRIL